MMNRYAVWFGRVVWMGIVVNMLFIVPLVFFPEWLFGLLRLEIVQPIIWARVAGMFLFIISVFYIPAAMDMDRYRANAWLSIFPSRTFGAVFFLGAVVIFDHPKGFLAGAITDILFAFGHLTFLLLAIRAEEGDRNRDRVR